MEGTDMKKSLLIGILAVAVLFSVVAYATADTANYTGAGNPLSASGTVNVAAQVNPKLTLTVTTPDAGQSVDFGPLDPGTTTGGKTVNLSVNSNKRFDVGISENLGAFSAQGIAITRSLAASTNNAKGQNVGFADNYSINVPWTADPGSYTGTVVYTVTQQ